MTDPKPLPPPMTLCPILTAAAIAKPRVIDTPRIALGVSVGTPDRAPEPEAVVCQGKQCMLYIVQRDPVSGAEVAGRCAITMGVVAIGMLNETVARLSADPSKKN
jgi:hypothetical protein